uniref:Secreted protein n=1 Tax=Romanomermis culicivorax TaxID=13658 RepID=A0A915L530_ROMCU
MIAWFANRAPVAVPLFEIPCLANVALASISASSLSLFEQTFNGMVGKGLPNNFPSTSSNNSFFKTSHGTIRRNFSFRTGKSSFCSKIVDKIPDANFRPRSSTTTF